MDAPSAAAILDDGSADVDALLAAIARDASSAGRRVRGLLMTYPAGKNDCLGPMVLVDLATGDEYKVSQSLGTGSRACRADPHGFARASAVLRNAAEDADLVICNRFGNLEADGKGFTAELLTLLAAGIPLLTVVAARHRQRWVDFTGGAAVLPADADVVRDWLVKCCRQSSTGSNDLP